MEGQANLAVVGCGGHSVDDLTLDGVDVLKSALFGKHVVHAEKSAEELQCERREKENGVSWHKKGQGCGRRTHISVSRRRKRFPYLGGHLLHLEHAQGWHLGKVLEDLVDHGKNL